MARVQIFLPAHRLMPGDHVRLDFTGGRYLDAIVKEVETLADKGFPDMTGLVYTPDDDGEWDGEPDDGQDDDKSECAYFPSDKNIVVHSFAKKTGVQTRVSRHV